MLQNIYILNKSFSFFLFNLFITDSWKTVSQFRPAFFNIDNKKNKNVIYTDQNYRCNTLVFAIIFNELNSKI